MIEAVRSVYGKYFDFSGRASRAEYWWFWLFGVAVEFIALIALRQAGVVLLLVFGVFNFIPSWTVLVRRLHDTGRSGWWMLISLVPLIGSIWLFVLTLLGGDQEPNEYGPKPAH